jgi:hypothetical protein
MRKIRWVCQFAAVTGEPWLRYRDPPTLFVIYAIDGLTVARRS